MNKKGLKFKKSALCSAILCAISSAHAATISVDDNCSLIDAIQSANDDASVGSCIAGSGSDVIQVVNANESIVINSIFTPPIAFRGGGSAPAGLPVINSNITIEGNGLTVRADHSTEKFGLFVVDGGGDLTLRDTTVTGADNDQGAGSGLLSVYGRVSIENCTFALNNGAVLLAYGTGHEITNTVIRHNTGTGEFAAGFQAYFAEVDISQTSFVDNEHSYNSSSPALRGGGGGGLPTIAGGAGLLQSEVSITDSTFSGNKAIYGAAILLSTASTSSSSPGRGGGIGSQLDITNSTITNNESLIGGGVLNFGYSIVNMSGSLIAGNQATLNGSAPFGDTSNIYNGNVATFNLNANNIIGDNGSTGSSNLTLGASDRSFSNYTQDNLYPLSLSQGQLVHPLKLGSDAIDGNDITCFGSTADQEGKGRGIDGDNDGSFICDVGAFEHSLPIAANGAPCTLVNALESAETDASVGGCQPGNGHDIIVLPENSTQGFVSPDPANSYAFGIAAIETAVTIAANGSVIERETTAADDFDLFFVEKSGQLNLIDATVTGANGPLAAITTYYGNVNVVDSNISNNQSGAIFDIYSINSSVHNSTVSQNVLAPAGALASYSPLTTRNTIGFELRQSTISDNTGGLGGGLDLRGVRMAVLENSTISGNTGGAVGGLIAISGDYNTPIVGAHILNSTITSNSGGYTGGIYIDGGGDVRMSHAIVSGNELAAPPAPNLSLNNDIGILGGLVMPSVIQGDPTPEIISGSTAFMLNNNIIGQNGLSGSSGVVIGPSDIVPVGATDTVIDNILADNGGITLTHLPISTGPAVDGGNASCGLVEDQTGRIRPWDGDGDGNDTCDIGSVELGSVYASDLIFKDGFDATIILRRHVLKN